MHSRLLTRIGTLIDWIEKSVIVLFLTGIVGLVFSGVLSRYVFHYSLAFTEELARFLFIWGALVGAAAALRSGEHGGIPILASRFGPRGRRFVERFVALGIIIFMAYLVYMTGVSTSKSFASGQISTTTEIPVWVINAGMMLAFALGLLRAIEGYRRGVYSPTSGDVSASPEQDEKVK